MTSSMLRRMNFILATIALASGIWATPARVVEAQDKHALVQTLQLSGHDAIWGIDQVEWFYKGDVVVTDQQGRFCEAFKCAHGRGELETDGDWHYSGTFRYGDIVGKGEMQTEDGDYSGLFSSNSFPAGPPPLCGAPDSKAVVHSGWWPKFVQFYPDQPPCAGLSCTIMDCLKAWVDKVDRGETLSPQDVERIRRWYGPITERQISLRNGESRRTFDKIQLAGMDLRDFLAARGWRPLSGAAVFFPRYLRSAAGGGAIQWKLGGHYQIPYTEGADVPVSEMLPIALWSGSSVTAIEDPWTAAGLAIEISPTSYVVRFPEREGQHW